VVHQLIGSFGKRNVSVPEIAAQLAADPVLSAKTLRLANSAYFRLPRRVATVDDALQMLGFEMVRNMVLAFGAIGAFKSAPGMDLRGFWRYSLNTACVARWLVQRTELEDEAVFTIGLIHGIGQLLMHGALPVEMKQLDRDVHPLAPERARIELAQLGYHHGQVSAELGRRWNFPAGVCEALRGVPDPTRDGATLPTAGWVHLAAWRAQAELFHWNTDELTAHLPEAVCRNLQRPPAWLTASATPGATHADAWPLIPPLAQLTEGLDAMLT